MDSRCVDYAKAFVVQSFKVWTIDTILGRTTSPPVPHIALLYLTSRLKAAEIPSKALYSGCKWITHWKGPLETSGLRIVGDALGTSRICNHFGLPFLKNTYE